MLSSVFAKNTQKNTDGRITNVICNSAKQGLIPQREYFDKDIANSDNTNGYYIIEENDFVYNPRKSADAPYGPISSYKYTEAGIVSPLYLCFRAKKEINPAFFEWYFRSSAWHRYVYMSGDSGARHDRVSIKDDTFFAMPINIPSAHEQAQIANFLERIEQRIEMQRALVDSLKKYKRGLSSSLFDEISKSGCPTVSFADGFRLLQNNTFSRDDLSYDVGDVRNIHYGDVLIKYGTVTDIGALSVPCIKPDRDIEKFSSSSYLRNGDIVFADTAEDYTVGKATEIVGVTNQRVLSGLHTIPCRPHDRFAPMFLGHYFNSYHFRRQIYRMIQGIKVSSISKSEIAKTTILTPPYDVQRKVASVLSEVDHLIEKEAETVIVLQKIRRGLLQQLFI